MFKRNMHFCFIFVLLACNQPKTDNVTSVSDTLQGTYPTRDTTALHEFSLSNSPEKDSVNGRPVNFYITDPECYSAAVDFYKGNFRPAADAKTDSLLAYASTNNEKLRPFYRWCLDMTMQMNDPLVAARTSKPAWAYAEKFPAEFIRFMDEDTTRERYGLWLSAIHSGLEVQGDTASFASNMKNRMEANCINCNAAVKKRISRFVDECMANDPSL